MMRTIITMLVLTCGLCAGCAGTQKRGQHRSISVMTWNIWGRLNQAPKYTIDGKTARQRCTEIIRESGADIICMIEAYGSASDIAKALDYHLYTPSDDANLAIFSRYPLSDMGTPAGLSPFSFIAATATLPEGQKVRIYNIWLTSEGRHIVEIKNPALSDSAFCAGDDIRHVQLQKLLLHPDLKKHQAVEEMSIIIAGDFNCVSHLDYTEDTKLRGVNRGRILPIKASRGMEKTGFIDTYRSVHPNITNGTMGHTWTTVGKGFTYIDGKGFVPVARNPSPEYRDPFARIDFIYCYGEKVNPIASRTIVHHASNKTRSFPEFPSDHAAVLTSLQIEMSPVSGLVDR